MKKIIFGFSDEFKLPVELMTQFTEQFKNDFQFCVDGLESKPEIFKNADAFIGWPSDRMIQAMTNLSWLQLPSAGADHFAHHHLLKDQVTVTNASGVFGALGAEHILALILAFVRQLPLYVRQTEKHIWHVEPEVRQLEGSTVAIIGLGDIGLEAAVRLKAFGSRILAVKRTVTKKPDCVDDVFDMNGLSTVLGESDFVVNVLPLTAETEGLFDETKFSFMKEGAIFINVGRGATVDEQALIRALRSGRMGGAGLDVTSHEPLPEDSELWNFPNVLITSHSLGAGPGKLKKRAELIRKNLENFRDGKPLINVVDRKLGY
ncbi:D-2-hydroxyacid dehydrogenase [Sporolactobacillus pectinivorans]|uniref:D-2-hydroxyacid dehydrogenase n=1 Tax=Sporolactobacillus pectinivorans TaxID=1591408 RepID=UPI000C2641F7|nr:D-2-hydroxyacid dehydrogenase [Sporolactobacillus pectinivorans]